MVTVMTIMRIRKTRKHAPMMMKEMSDSTTSAASGPLTW